MRSALLLLFGGLAVAAAVSAQTVYRYVFPDGRVVYSDAPVPGAKLQGTLAPPPPAAPAPEGARPGSAPAQGGSASPGADRTARLAAATAEVSAAEAALENARAAQINGKEPLPGETTGIAKGGTRLNEAYWERQEQLQKAIDAAQARLERAVAARNAAR